MRIKYYTHKYLTKVYFSRNILEYLTTNLVRNKV